MVPTSSGTLGTFSAVLLAGGASSRMGRDKAHLDFQGEPVATRISRLLASLFAEVWIVGGDPPESAVGRRIPDCAGPRCALRGLVTGLEAATRERVLVVATDLPLVTADLLLALCAWPEADAVVPADGGRLQPLCAVYRRDRVLEMARSRLADGVLALSGLLDVVEISTFGDADLASIDPDRRALTNVNTPDELAEALSPRIS